VHPERPARTGSRWPWLSLLPLGLGAWVPIYAGVRARVKTWIALGVLWSAIAVAGWIVSTGSTAHGHHKSSAAAGLLIVLAWIGAIATSFVIRPAFERRVGSPLLSAEEQAEARLRDRQRALEIARANPTLAREMGVGRPDLPGASDAGLVDVNHAAASALMRLPGIGEALATEIVEGRARVGGFSSIEDLGIALDIPGDVIEGLRGQVVFLPR
jgi:hypothetical protein